MEHHSPPREEGPQPVGELIGPGPLLRKAGGSEEYWQSARSRSLRSPRCWNLLWDRGDRCDTGSL